MISENIKKLRNKKGLTQEELAIRLNVVRQTISKWEKGVSVPDAYLLKKLAIELDTSVGKLLGTTIELENNEPEIAEQIARISEQLAVRNKRWDNVIKVIKIILICILVFIVMIFVLNFSVSSRSTTEIEYQEIQID